MEFVQLIKQHILCEESTRFWFRTGIKPDVVFLPLNGCSGSSRPALGEAVTLPAHSGHSCLLVASSLPDLPSVRRSKPSIDVRVCSVRLGSRPAEGQVHPAGPLQPTVEGTG